MILLTHEGQADNFWRLEIRRADVERISVRLLNSQPDQRHEGTDYEHRHACAFHSA